MKTKNSKPNKPYRYRLTLADKFNLIKDRNTASTNLSI